MDKGLTVPEWVLILWPKILKMHQNSSAQFVYPSSKVLDFNEKRLHVRDIKKQMISPRCENVMPGLEPTLPAISRGEGPGPATYDT